MTTTTTNRTAKQRSINVVATEGDWFLLQIEAAGKLDYYLARKLDADPSFGQAYELEKQDEHGTADVYHVTLKGQHSTCSCPGGCFRPHKRCKHVSGLQALAAHGKLPGYRSPSLVEVTAKFRPGRDDEPAPRQPWPRPSWCGCRSSEEHEQLCEQPLIDAEYNAAVA